MTTESPAMFAVGLIAAVAREAAQAPRHTAGAMIAAAIGTALRDIPNGQVDAEVTERMSKIKPALLQLVSAGASKTTPRLSGSTRALRNCGLHASLGEGVAAVPQTGAEAKRCQRGHRQPKAVFPISTEPDSIGNSMETDMPHPSLPPAEPQQQGVKQQSRRHRRQPQALASAELPKSEPKDPAPTQQQANADDTLAKAQRVTMQYEISLAQASLEAKSTMINNEFQDLVRKRLEEATDQIENQGTVVQDLVRKRFDEASDRIQQCHDHQKNTFAVLWHHVDTLNKNADNHPEALAKLEEKIAKVEAKIAPPGRGQARR